MITPHEHYPVLNSIILVVGLGGFLASLLFFRKKYWPENVDSETVEAFFIDSFLLSLPLVPVLAILVFLIWPIRELIFFILFSVPFLPRLLSVPAFCFILVEGFFVAWGLAMFIVSSIYKKTKNISFGSIISGSVKFLLFFTAFYTVLLFGLHYVHKYYKYCPEKSFICERNLV